MTDLAAILRDGNNVDMPALRAWLANLSSRAGSLAAFGAVSVVKDTRAHLNADLAHPDGALSLTWNDATDANNDFSVKVGASGTGTWSLTSILHDSMAAYASNVFQPLVDEAHLAAKGAAWTLVAGNDGGDRITINNETGRITTNGQLFAASGSGFVAIPGSQDVAIPGTASNLVSFYFDTSTGVLGAVVEDEIPSGKAVFAYQKDNFLWAAASIGTADALLFVDEDGRTATPLGSAEIKIGRTVVGAGMLTVDLAQSLILTSGQLYAIAGGAFKLIGDTQSVAFTWSGRLVTIYVDMSSGAVGSILDSVPSIPLGCAPVAYLFNETLFPVETSAGRASMRLVGTDGTVVDPLAVTFDDTRTREIVPDHMYFITGRRLPLYKSSILIEPRVKAQNDLRMALVTGLAGDDDPYRPIDDRIMLDPSALGSTFSVGFWHALSDSRNAKAIAKHVAPANALNAASPKILYIGDSIGAQYMIKTLADILTTLGATPTFLGTYDSGFNSGLLGEARGGWGYKSFIGRDSSYAGTGVTIPGAGTTTTQGQNPWLRVATSGDYSAHPERCFKWAANTYKLQSYVESGGAAGTYYIFDPAYYASGRGVATPDYVFIALGDNDFLWGGGVYTIAQQISFGLAAMEIMVRALHEAWPSAKIGVSPLAARGAGATMNQAYVTKYGPWIEQITDKIRDLAADIPTLDCVPIWPSTNREWAFAPTATADLSATNNSQRQDMGEVIHYYPDGGPAVGKTQFANVIASWLACKVAGV
ncbi:hypothetical protein BH09PSE4_BH09PSE4_21830 [soil metagenome]